MIDIAAIPVNVHVETSAQFVRTMRNARGMNTFAHGRRPVLLDRQSVARMIRDTLDSINNLRAVPNTAARSPSTSDPSAATCQTSSTSWKVGTTRFASTNLIKKSGTAVKGAGTGP